MAMNRQVGGDHYLKLGMQPFYFTLINGWDAASHTVLKYVSRHHNVERAEAIESLRKAIHICEIMESAMKEGRFIHTALMTPQIVGIAEYCQSNQLDDLEALALQYLSGWIYEKQVELDGEPIRFGRAMVANAIEDILINRYGVSA